LLHCAAAGNGKVWGVDVAMTEFVASRSKRKLLYCFLGIFVSYFIYGILQENMWVCNTDCDLASYAVLSCVR